MGAFDIANIASDKGDVDYDSNDYAEESKEPARPIRDNIGRLMALTKTSDLKARVKAFIPSTS